MASSFLSFCLVRPIDGNTDWTEVKDKASQQQKVRSELKGFAHSSRWGSSAVDLSRFPHCAKNVIAVVAKRGKSSLFVGDRRVILFSAICRKPLNLLAKRLLRQDLAN